MPQTAWDRELGDSRAAASGKGLRTPHRSPRSASVCRQRSQVGLASGLLASFGLGAAMLGTRALPMSKELIDKHPPR